MAELEVRSAQASVQRIEANIRRLELIEEEKELRRIAQRRGLPMSAGIFGNDNNK